MASIPRSVMDAMTRHNIDLQRYSNAEVRRIITLLNRTDAALMERIAAKLDNLPASATLKQIEEVLQSVRELNATAYERVEGGIKTAMQDLAPVEAAFIGRLYTHAVPEISFAAVSARTARAAALARPFQGRLLSEWAKSLEENRLSRLRDVIRIGFVSGQTVGDLVRQIRGTKAAKYADGLLEGDRRSVERVVRAALSHTAQSTRNDWFAANDDILGDEVWISTLDGRTSAMCQVRSGLRYTYPEHKPIGHSVPYLAGPGRLHWNCRSTSIRLLKGQKRLSGTRSSADGYVDANMTYGQWLRAQPAAVQNDILGPTRGLLFREGGLDLQGFYNDKGKLLTLAQLAARSAAAFERAGIE
ncbi:MAG: hypothetical protein WC997_18005 [Porticoccaceae bacterium]